MRRFVALLVTATAAALLGCGCSVAVATGLDEPDANRVVVTLDRAGIDSVKEIDPAVEGRFRVSVARDDTPRALSTMAEEQVPRVKSRGLNEASERGQLVQSPSAEHAQLMSGLGGELERTLGAIDGVLTARVHLNLPVRDGLRDSATVRATASVLVEHRGMVSPLPLDAVQRLVAGGAPGLAPADVAVVFVAHAVRPVAPRPELSHVGPIAVARGSTNVLRTALAGLVLLVLTLAAASLVLYGKLVRIRRSVASDPRALSSGRTAIGAVGGAGARPSPHSTPGAQ